MTGKEYSERRFQYKLMKTICENYEDGYYHFSKDLQLYPNAWCYIVWSKRGPGKTYSALWYAYNNYPIIYMKRTTEDVNLICSANSYGFDPSPYVPLNRDKCINVKAREIKKGIGAFWETDSEGNPEGLPKSYILSLNAIKRFKGFDFSQCEWLLLDEFIPQVGEIVKRGEGEMLLDLYMTIARDRQKRGRKPLKLVLFANAEEISTPVTNTLEVVDIMADLNASGQNYYYDEARGIMLHHITNDEYPIRDEEKVGIYSAMKHTAWGQKAFEGEFANNDFSNVVKMSIKGMKPYIHLKHKTFDYYIYMRSDGFKYMCQSKAENCLFEYDLTKENDQKLFFRENCIDLRRDCIEDRMKFQKYSMYDLIANYKRIFEI